MLLDEASEAYYKGQPIMSDEEFDALEQPEYVGHKISGIPHKYPMWSLQKAYDGDNPLSWYRGRVVKSPKLDGAAVALYYRCGELQLALTRGNGKEGLDITDKMRTLVPSIPHLGEIQITGEVAAPKHINNSRNYAAGALNLKSVEEFRTRELYFIAYGVAPFRAFSYETWDEAIKIVYYGLWSKDMAQLAEWGFSTVLSADLDMFPHDGVVYRIDDYADFESAGYTSKHPKGAYAAKERTEGSITTLIGVEWSVGRSGVIAPTALLEPVKVGDALVSRATLHNMAYIEALGLEIGCKVEVIRSGEIIPRIVRRV
jgi:DNA ligase (NAD+)